VRALEGPGPLSSGVTPARSGLAIATLTFSCLLVLGFAWQLLIVPGVLFSPSGLAFVPGSLFGGADLPYGSAVIPPPATLVTHQFLHAGWLHLAANLLFLWIFGPRVEATVGAGPWTVLLLACGVAAALSQAWPETSSPVAMIGASGGISGLLGAYLVLHPRDEFRLTLPGVPGMQLPAWAILLLWFGLQAISALWAEVLPGGVAFRAHVGGFACGLLVAPVLHFMVLLSADARPVARSPRSRDSSH